MCSSCRTACHVFFEKSWPVLQCICPNSPCECVVFQLLPGSILPNTPMLLCSVQRGVYPPSGCILQLINIQQGGLQVCVMDGCRWGVWQLINALIISSEDLPLLPELTEWAVCGLTSNAVFRARPLLSALPGSHSFSSQRKMCTFCAEKVFNSDETVKQGVGDLYHCSELERQHFIWKSSCFRIRFKKLYWFPQGK